MSIKLETANPVRSFKARGAEVVASLLADNGSRAVVCASGGNLGQALAWSGRPRDLDVTVVSSRFGPAVKLDRMRALGARLELVDGDHEMARARAAAIARHDGIRLLEDSLDIETCEGAATIGLELVNAASSFDTVLIALGGGALATGVGHVMKAFAPDVEVICVQPAGAPAMTHSWRRRRVVTTESTDALAIAHLTSGTSLSSTDEGTAGRTDLMPTTRWDKRVDTADWPAIAATVDEYGGALLPRLLTPAETQRLRALYARDQLFRATIDMGPRRYGSGQYRYFRAPYPEPIEHLKQALYPRLLPIARDWWTRLGRDAPWPDSFDEWLDICHAAGQTRSTALMLRYGAGDWNALHRDLYGDLVFPLQVVISLSASGTEYTGGEFMLVEQRARAQSRGTTTQLPQGHGYLFTTRDRPVRSARGWSAAPVSHGLSVVRSGERYALGLIFHDAA